MALHSLLPFRAGGELRVMEDVGNGQMSVWEKPMGVALLLNHNPACPEVR